MKRIIDKLQAKAKSQTPITWVLQIASTIMAISYALALVSIVFALIVPWQYLVLAVLVTCPLVVWLLIISFARKLTLRRNIALIAASLAIAIASLYAYTTMNATTRFLDGLQGSNYTYVDYNIVAKRDRHIQLSPGTNQTVGLLKADYDSTAVKDGAKAKTAAQFKSYDDIASLTVSLDKQDTSVAVLSSSQLQLLQENYSGFYQSIEVLATFSTRVAKDTAATVDTTKPFVVYISGIDTYSEVDTVSRSDVNILAVVNPQTHKILLVNTPRDYYVQLHGTTGSRDKLTHAGIYGIDMSIQTLQDLYGTNIDYYLRINFASLTKLVDAVGGVDVNSEYDFKTGKYTFHQGYNHLDGNAALAFSRERYSFAAGDRTRGQNQQRVIEAIIRKMNSPQTLVNYQNILASLQGAMQTNASSSDITSLINRQMNSLATWQTESVSVDGTGKSDYTYSMGNIKLYVMEPDTSTVETAKQKIQQYKQ